MSLTIINILSSDCVVVEGYGLTECSAPCTLTLPGDLQVIILFPASQSTSGLQPGHVGPPLPCNMVKLADVAHMEYFTSGGQGEVCIRGLNVFQGYFRDEERSAASLDTGGWLHTGDIGEWTSWGTLRIIDKTKTIFKLANGNNQSEQGICFTKLVLTNQDTAFTCNT